MLNAVSAEIGEPADFWEAYKEVWVETAELQAGHLIMMALVEKTVGTLCHGNWMDTLEDVDSTVPIPLVLQKYPTSSLMSHLFRLEGARDATTQPPPPHRQLSLLLWAARFIDGIKF